jgi:hypothetical protein
MINNSRKVIRSATFPGVYLRLDGNGITHPVGEGGGTVNCQYGAGPYETLDLVSHPDGTVTIGSTTFPNVFLRLAGPGITGYLDSGGGRANCQFTAGPYEKFRLVPQADGSTAIASTAFPNVFLRMDGRGVTRAMPAGGGIVNAQFGVGPYEKFVISDVTQGLSEQELRRAIETYGPVLKFHPNEIFNMCSIEAFLQHAKLHDKNTGTEINHPTVAQLPTGTSRDGRYWLILEDGYKGGDLTTAKAYVRAYWTPGMSWTDLQFWFFYAYNGPATAHINGLAFDSIVHSGNPNLAPLGEHFGDWECCMIRVDNSSKQMIRAWLSQHSSGQTFESADLHQFQRVNGQQIVVYSSLNGHAVYAHPGSNYSEHRKYPDPGIPAGIEFFLRNDTADGGRSLDCAKNYQIISAEWLGSDFPEPQWVNYPYRWGPEGTVIHMNPNTVSEVLYSVLGWLSILPNSSIKVIASYILWVFVRDDVNGPDGPKYKSTWTGGY